MNLFGHYLVNAIFTPWALTIVVYCLWAIYFLDGYMEIYINSNAQFTGDYFGFRHSRCGLTATKMLVDVW